MTSLLDIGDLTKTVVIRGKELQVSGISGKVFMRLLAAFPELQKIMGGAAHKVEPKDLLQQVPTAVAAVLAAGTGTPGDEKAEEVAGNLGLGEQAELLHVIWELTFPRGVQSFIEALEAFKGQVEGSGWDPVTPSPGQSNNSSQPAIPPTTSGITPPG